MINRKSLTRKLCKVVQQQIQGEVASFVDLSPSAVNLKCNGEKIPHIFQTYCKKVAPLTLNTVHIAIHLQPGHFI